MADSVMPAGSVPSGGTDRGRLRSADDGGAVGHRGGGGVRSRSPG